VTESSRDDKDREEADDPILRSMRSVWVSMRDEEPSSRGLTDLLAAARVKAEQLQLHEPWWRRAFAVLRRPPVLAMASVVVLVGGSLLIHLRESEIAVRDHVTTSTSPDQALPGPLLAPVPPGRAESAAPPVTAAAPEAFPGGAPSPASPASPAPGRPRPKRDRGRPVEPLREPEATLGLSESAPIEPAAGPPMAGLTIATDEPAPSPSAPPPPTTARSLKAATDDGDANLRRGASIELLVKQAELAAARSDCPAVRATANQIKKLDAAAYKARLESQSAIARCLK